MKCVNAIILGENNRYGGSFRRKKTGTDRREHVGPTCFADARKSRDLLHVAAYEWVEFQQGINALGFDHHVSI